MISGIIKVESKVKLIDVLDDCISVYAIIYLLIYLQMLYLEIKGSQNQSINIPLRCNKLHLKAYRNWNKTTIIL